MNYFTQIEKKTPAPAQAETARQDKEFFVKRALARSINRDPEIQDAVLDWLISFQGAMGKEYFNKQLTKLSADNTQAIDQLAKSKGKRVLQNIPRIKPPKMPAPIITLLGKYQSVAIEAASGKKAITEFLSTLPSAGVYILDVNELILEYTDYQHRGKAGEIIEAANRASVLVIEGLEKPIALAYHIKDTLYQLAAVRKKDKDKFTLSTWNYTHQWYIPEYAECFTIFSV